MKKVLSIGQCAADHSRISQMLNTNFQVEIDTSDEHHDAIEKIRNSPFDLVIVNRILDQTGSEGLEIIKEIKQDDSIEPVPVMLISNFEDAQQSAIALGAEPGFGKASLNEDSVISRLGSFLRL